MNHRTFIAIFAITLTSLTAFAIAKTRIPASTTEITVSCSQPKNFAGLSANVSGTLKLASLPSGGATATGKLKIVLANPRAPWSGEKLVMGQYDDLTSVGSERYFHGGTTIKDSSDAMEIYVSYSRADSSFIEYGGDRYLMTCK